MQLNRHLRKTKATDGRMVIELSICWNQMRVRWSSGLRISPKSWDKNRKRVKNNGDTFAVEYNTLLDEQERIAEGVLNGFLLNKVVPTESEVKRGIDIALGRVKEVVVPVKEKHNEETVIGSWRAFIESQAPRYSAGYAGNHQSAMNMLNDYKENLRWDDIDQKVIEGFVNFMIEQDLSNSTIKVYLSRFFRLVDEIRETGVVVPVNMRKIYIDKHNCIPLFHNIMEVRRIMDTVYSSENTRVVADAYLFAIGSGVRFSDLVRISDAEVTLVKNEGETVGYLQLVQKKTSELLTVTMTDLATDIWMKYKGNPLASYKRRHGSGPIYISSYQHYLRKVGKEAGIDEVVIKRWKVGSEWREERGPKWEFMSSHMARHTHAMIGLELGIPIEVIQKGMGHSDISSTMRYARISESKASEQIKLQWKKLK